VHESSLDQPIVVVSGLPRSGTSMMMAMLDAGGQPILTDNLRTADASNPRGYFEYERVKALKDGDTEWLSSARGKAVKIVSPLLKHLPPDGRYDVLFMLRDVREVLASQRQMLLRAGNPAPPDNDEMLAAAFERHLADVRSWLEASESLDVLFVSHSDVIADPEPRAVEINQFLGGRLDVAAMTKVVDASLYRQRTSTSTQRL
jgi:hypothetical protein